MTGRLRFLLPAVPALAVTLGCLRPAPPVVYHVLRPLAPMAIPAPRPGPALEVLPVELPDLLQRPQMVTGRPDGSFALLPGHRWGTPLDRDMQRVLVADLGNLLGGTLVVPSPLGERLPGARRLTVVVAACVLGTDGVLEFDATWMVAPAGAGPALLVRRTQLREAAGGNGPEDLAAAHSRALAALAGAITKALEGLPQPSGASTAGVGD